MISKAKVTKAVKRLAIAVIVVCLAAVVAIVVLRLSPNDTTSSPKVPAEQGGEANIPAQTATIDGLRTSFWLPPSLSGPAPVILYSHGMGACGKFQKYLGRALAQNGYIVLAPMHEDASCLEPGAAAKMMDLFFKPDLWDENTYRSRAIEIHKLVNGLKKDPEWKNRIDWSKMGMLGYSLGGYTALSLAGGWPGWKLDGIKAVLVQAPYTMPLVQRGNLGTLGIPVMYQVAVWDPNISDPVLQPNGAYDRTSAPAWLVKFNNADHAGFVDVNLADPQMETRLQVQKDILYYTLWFFNHALQGTAEPLESRPNVLDLRSK